MAQPAYQQNPLALELLRLRDIEGITFQAIATQTGVNRSIISNFVNNGAPLTSERQTKLWTFVNRVTEDSSAEQLRMPSAYKSSVELYRTAEFHEVVGWCDYVFAKRKMGVMVGHPGSGKTTILRHVAETNPGVLYVEAWHTMRVGDLLESIAQPLGIVLRGNSYSKTQALISALRGRQDIFIAIDEAEYLCRRNVDKLEVLRKIWDNTGTPIILCGTVVLEDLLTRGKGGDNLAQLYRRKVEIKLSGISVAEARAILRDYNVTADTMEPLAALAGDVKHGGMGTFVELLGLCLEAAEGGPITPEILIGAKKHKLMW